MNDTFATSIKWWYYTGAEWTDISDYVMQERGCQGSWGMRYNKYTDRLAGAGVMSFSLLNTSGEFDPDDVDVLTGWGINTKVKLEVVYDGVTYRRFYGYVEEIRFSDNEINEHIANITVKDWMDYAYKRTITDIGIETYKRGGYAVDKVVDEVGFIPLATQYSEGDYEFDAIFDSLTTTTKAATELNKIVLSENGYLYNRHDKVNGETLVFESESYRNGLRTLSQLPVLAASSGLWELEANTDEVLLEDESGNVILDATQDAHINGTAQRYTRTHGENILNSITVTAYPKRVDSTEQTLYSLGTFIKVRSGETKTITVKYQNKDTKESCNAITSLMIQPVATTDYLMNTKKDGTGTDITSDLTVTVEYHTASADVTLTNASGYTGRITKLELRGYGIYQDSSIKATSEDTGSIDDYGLIELNIEQQYQRDTTAGEDMADRILEAEKSPRTKLDKVQMIANTSDTHMAAFLSIDIGDMVKITESGLGLGGSYYVQGIDFDIIDGSAIVYSWTLQDSGLEGLYYGTLSLIAPEFTAESTDIIEYGEIPSLVDLPEQSVTAWIYVTTLDFAGEVVVRWVDNAGGFEWRGRVNEVEGFRSTLVMPYTDGGGIWISDYDTTYISANKWACMGISVVGTTIKFYANGNLIGTNVFTEPVGVRESIEGANYTVGNIRSIDGPTDYSRPFPGKLADIRHHNVILTDAEMATVYADGIGGDGVTRGLLFQGPCVKTADLTYFTDRTLTADDRLTENVGGYVGVPTAGVVTRVIT